MGSFAPKRTNSADLARLVEATVTHIPPAVVNPTMATPAPAPVEAPAPAAPKAEATVQINFRGSKGLAKLIAELAEKDGSTRKLIARLLKEAGHSVPEVDLNPPDNRRRFD